MVIILGSGRSGTTWLGKLFDSHPDVVYRHEPDSLNVNTLIPFLPPKHQAPRYVEAARLYLKELRAARYAKSLGQRPFFAKSYRSSPRQSGFVASAMALKALEQFHRAGLPPAWLRVPAFLDVPPGASATFVIKSVSSLCRAYLFSRAAPDANIIHIVRHPCGVVASRLRGIAIGLMSGETYLESLFRIDEVARYPFTYEYMKNADLEQKMTYQWMIQNDKVFVEMKNNPNYRLVRYEELCAKPCRVIKNLFQFVGLGWSSQTERFIKSLEEKADRPSAYHGVMRSPSASVDRWTRELDREQITWILGVAAHSQMRECGLGW
jgi:hypothetical protein